MKFTVDRRKGWVGFYFFNLVSGDYFVEEHRKHNRGVILIDIDVKYLYYMHFCEASSLLLQFFPFSSAHIKAFIFHKRKIKQEKRTLAHVYGSYLQFAAELCLVLVFTNSLSRAPERKVPPTNQH